jgi:hypothetical protein
MNNIKTISKYTFLEQFFPYYPNKKATNLPNSYPLRIIYLSFTYLLFIYFTGVFSHSIGKLYLSQENGEAMYFTLFGIALTLTILIFYLAKMLSTFFSIKDTNLYKTLPIGQGELFIGKLFGSVFSFIDFYVLFIISIAVYFYFKGFDLGVLIFGIINFLSLIMIPYTILTGLILVIMKFTNVGKHRKLFKNIGYIILFFIVGMIYYFSFSKNNSSPESNGQVFNSVIDTLSGISNVFFSSKLYGMSLSGSIINKIVYTLILFAISAVLVFILYKLADNFYYDALENKRSSKSSKKEVVNIDFKRNSQVKTIFKRDIKNLFSNIVFISQAIIMIIIFAIMSFNIGKDIISDMGNRPDLNTFRFWMFLAGYSLGILIWINSGFASNDLSREHSSFYLFQTLPINPRSHYRARFLTNFLASSIFSLILSIIAAIALKTEIIGALAFFIGQELAIILATNMGLYMGSKNIKTNWNKPEELSKSGIQGAIFYFAGLIYVAIIILLYIFVTNEYGQRYNILASIIDLIIIFATIIPFRQLAIKAYKKGFYDI